MSLKKRTMIKVVYGVEPDQEWHDVITFMKEVAASEDIDISEIEIGDESEGCAFASVYEKKIYLFSKSRAVALHELAHIETLEGHTWDWAICFAYFCKTYLQEQEYLREMFKAEKQYRSVNGLVQYLAANDSLDETSRWAWGKTK